MKLTLAALGVLVAVATGAGALCSPVASWMVPPDVGAALYVSALVLVWLGATMILPKPKRRRHATSRVPAPAARPARRWSATRATAPAVLRGVLDA